MNKDIERIIKQANKKAIENNIRPFTKPQEALVVQAMEEYKKTTWYPQSHRPPLSKDKDGFSISVLLYSPSMELYSIGWFDFNMDTWEHIADEQMEDFVWSRLVKHKSKNTTEKNGNEEAD